MELEDGLRYGLRYGLRFPTRYELRQQRQVDPVVWACALVLSLTVLALLLETARRGLSALAMLSRYNVVRDAPAGDCCACLDCLPLATAQPCGHACLCTDCACELWRGPSKDSCPLCREWIDVFLVPALEGLA